MGAAASNINTKVRVQSDIQSLTCDQATDYRPVQIEINGIGGVGPFPDELI